MSTGRGAYQARDRAILVECWEYRETLESDVPALLRALADDLDSSGAALLSLIVAAEEPYLQAIVDTERGFVPADDSDGSHAHG